MEELTYACLIGFATLFFSTSVNKIRNLDSHFIMIKNYKIIPKKLIPFFLYTEITLEIIVGITLMLGLYQGLGIFIMIGLLSVYSLAISINLLKGNNNISCGCGGLVGDHKLSWKLVFRNLGFLAVAVWLYQFDHNWSLIESIIAGDAFSYEMLVMIFIVLGGILHSSVIKNVISIRRRAVELLK
ncbi:MauE/DoxX family redox-associated membrane protein [Brevibacillus sp. MS2.2]|uniref:MauE/DoxX family redox-associated membrane protein n=1 Tax=Brevibacillus sp. MS2.2 TaxID=2738981 RepID=UPI00156B2080|nr:MauE/DoxX family redox-associated membrane protein [Brevibacillus sp. MS2.2]NRR24372.1 methylamine utilization protein MauE [Brevibacillus sp. MS2.2]